MFSLNSIYTILHRSKLDQLLYDNEYVSIANRKSILQKNKEPCLECHFQLQTPNNNSKTNTTLQLMHHWWPEALDSSLISRWIQVGATYLHVVLTQQ